VTVRLVVDKMTKKHAAVLACEELTEEFKILKRCSRYFDILVGKYSSLVLIYILRLTCKKNGQVKTKRR